MTTPDAVLGVDLGTSAVKAAVHTMDGRARIIRSCPVSLDRRGGGHVEQDLDEFVDAVAVATRAALADGDVATERIGAVAVAGQMAGVGIVDADHRPLAPFDSWLDTRCRDVVADLRDELGPRISATSGCAPTVSIGPKMAWWARHHPDTCRSAASFVTAAGYVAGRAVGLAGDEAFIDPTHLHFTSVADVAGSSWDLDLADAAGVPTDLLPRIVESASVVGELVPDVAAELGLVPGIPVAAGCGDTAAGALGAGVFEPGAAFDVAGTAAVLGACVTDHVPDPDGVLMTMRAAVPGRWYALSYVADAGQLIEWVAREVLGDPDRDPDDDPDLDRIAAIAAAAPAGCDGLTLFPHVSGRVAPAAPWVHGALLGLAPTHTRAHVVRAALESIALEYRHYVERIDHLHPDTPVRSVTGIGGGSRSETWNQVKADAIGVPYQPLLGIEAGTRGAAMLAIRALGHPLPPLGEADRGPVHRPDPTTRAAYDQAHRRQRAWSRILVAGFAQQAGPGSPDLADPDLDRS